MNATTTHHKMTPDEQTLAHRNKISAQPASPRPQEHKNDLKLPTLPGITSRGHPSMQGGTPRWANVWPFAPFRTSNVKNP